MAKRITRPEDDFVLADRYLRGESALSLAKEAGLSLNLVLRRLREHGVVIRQKGREPIRTLGLNPNDYAMFLEIVDGLMLGDGSILKDGILRLEQTIRRGEWVHHVAGLLRSIGVSCKVADRGPTDSHSRIKGRVIPHNGSTIMWSLTYQDMKDQRARWYPEGKKIVPRDVVLTPVSVALWFCGDGTSDKSTGTLSFCTNGFTRPDVEFLGDRLGKTVGIHTTTTHSETQPILRVCRRNDAVRIRDFMGNHVIPLFHYKFQGLHPANPKNFDKRTLTPDQVLEIRKMSQEGHTAMSLGRRFGTSNVTIGRIVSGCIYKEVGLLVAHGA